MLEAIAGICLLTGRMVLVEGSARHRAWDAQQVVAHHERHHSNGTRREEEQRQGKKGVVASRHRILVRGRGCEAISVHAFVSAYPRRSCGSIPKIRRFDNFDRGRPSR
jgi:hypothetical protein